MHATCLSEVDVVVLAGGQGTRLRAVFSDRPKILAPIHNAPFLRWYLEWLRGFGARRVILSLGYLAGMVNEYIRSQPVSGLDLEAFVESSPLGTGGAVRAVLPLLRSESALVTNGDSLTRVDLCRFIDFHRSKRARASMVLTWQPDVSQSGLVETGDDDAVIGYREKPALAGTGGYINAGLYLLRREAIAEIPDSGFVSIEKDVFPRFCGRGFYAFKGRFPFIDIGTPESYRRAEDFFAQEAA